LLNCRGQQEVQVLNLCQRRLSKAAVKDAFVLTYDCMRRYEGVWHMERKLLFPSYIFLVSENGDLLVNELSRAAVREQEAEVFSINDKEEEFLKALCGENGHLKMSKGVIRKGMTRITEGPLMGMEKQICRIDRHKRLAKLALPAGQRYRRIPGHPDRLSCGFSYISAGLEIAEKSL
jgi:transcriptional antiterminator NusG